jgi:large subunit ribosomal protein L4
MPSVPVSGGTGKAQTLELSADVFGGTPRIPLLHQAVVKELAARRAGTHSTRGRSDVSGGGRKPWKQKGTGRARVGDIRNPLWRHGGTVFGPQPRSYDYRLPLKVKRGAIVAALAAKIQDGSLVIVDELSASESRTKAAVELLKRLGADGKALLIDVQPDEKLGIAVRNLPGVHFLASSRVGARDVMDAGRVIATRAAVEKLQNL